MKRLERAARGEGLNWVRQRSGRGRGEEGMLGGLRGKGAGRLGLAAD